MSEHSVLDDGDHGPPGPRPDAKEMIYTMRLPGTTKLPVIAGKWRRVGNEIIAEYTTAEWQLCVQLITPYREEQPEQTRLWEEGK